MSLPRDGRDGRDGKMGPRGYTGANGAIGPMPSHEWDGTRVRFQKDDKSWGDWVDVIGLAGIDGKDGVNAYQLALEKGFKGSEDDWLKSLIGPKGERGDAGRNGLSAYEVAKRAGFKGTEAEWLLSLKAEGVRDGFDGKDGAQGLSAYELWLLQGYSGTEEDFFDWLAEKVREKLKELVTHGDAGPLRLYLHTLMDVDITNPTNGQVIKYQDGRWINGTGGGGGGAVDSVNGQTGVVVLDTGDISEVTDKNYVTDAELAAIGTALQTVAVLGTLVGDGTTGNPLGVNFIGGEYQLTFYDDLENLTSTDNAVYYPNNGANYYDDAQTRIAWKQNRENYANWDAKGLSGAVTVEFQDTSGTMALLGGINNVSEFINDAGYLTSLSGAVTNVTGTTNRITSSGGATPAIDISASYVGQGSITTVGTLSSGNATAIVDAASTSAAGKIQIADLTATNAGSSATLAVTPDGLAGSYAGTKSVNIVVTAPTTNAATGDGKAYLTIPAACNGMNLIRATATVVTAGTTGASTIQIHNVTQAADMLSGLISIASGGTVATAGTIDTGNDDVATNDVLRVDVDSVSTTPPKGLIVVLEFMLP